MSTPLKFSIIIPVKAINDYVRETVPHIQCMQNPNWELFIVPNEDCPNEWAVDSRISILSSGRLGPADKRDMAATRASGDILVFLDDDSYPEQRLLDVAEKHFLDTEVVAIGGPGITPPHDTFWQKVSGAVFLSKFSGGAPERYLPIGKVREIRDWPSVNLMVRRLDFLFIGGFSSRYWPGEDTKLCLDLIQKTQKKILYVPNLIVWHHRRAGFLAHLRQVGGYGLHRGHFARCYPETSRRLVYFMPSVFFLFTGVSLLAPWMPSQIKTTIFLGWFAYITVILLAFSSFMKTQKLSVSLCALSYIPFTHLFYGIRFIQGFFTKNLVSRLR